MFKVLNHYLYCKKHKKNFKINSSGWIFNIDKGWEDYFENTELIYNKTDIDDIKYTTHPYLNYFTINEYKNAIPEIYRYNKKTIEEINKRKSIFDIQDGDYDSIFIRRGDKLANESKLIFTNDYIELLLKINPYCKKIFLQTDDYNCYLDLKKYIYENNLNIKVYTLCKENDFGVIMHSYRKDELNTALKDNINKENKEYLSTIIDKLKDTKPVEYMSKEEKYDHVLTMMTGIDILINSNICITDYQSNVSRFIKLKHKNPKNVYDVINPYNDIDYNKKTKIINYF
jgi:hypothetical protein